MQKQHLTYDEIMAERSAGIPFPHLAGRSVSPRFSRRSRRAHTGEPRRLRLGHKATRARWARQGRR